MYNLASMQELKSESSVVVLATNTVTSPITDWAHSPYLYLVVSMTILLGQFAMHLSNKRKEQPVTSKNTSPAQVPFQPGLFRSQISSKLENDLLRLVNHDRQVAERLINREKTANPGRTEKWYWEKVVSDLERDRR